MTTPKMGNGPLPGACINGRSDGKCVWGRGSVGTRARAGLEGCAEMMSGSTCKWRRGSTGREEHTEQGPGQLRESNKPGRVALERSTGRQERSSGVRIQRVPNTRPGDRATWKNCKWKVVGGGLADVTLLAGQCRST